MLIFGGPYSNLQATEALLTRAMQLDMAPDHIICTGDIVAYGAQPEETTRLIQDAGIRVVMGNCEESLAADDDDCGCGFEAGMVCATLSEAWYTFARNRVSDQSRQWMATLPRILRFELAGRRCAVIHGGIGRINEFIFASTDTATKNRQLQQADADIIIAGHCGIPFGQTCERGVWLNAGVIGLPANDGTSDGWYLLLEPIADAIKASWHRLSYAHEHCYTVMLEAGQSGYADAMRSGLWPSMDILPATERSQRGCSLQFADLYA